MAAEPRHPMHTTPAGGAGQTLPGTARASSARLSGKARRFAGVLPLAGGKQIYLRRAGARVRSRPRVPKSTSSVTLRK